MHLVSDIVKHFTFDDINIDSWTFKLFYKGSFIFFLMGSMVGILSQYFGEPINCDFKGIDSEMASDYCWIHGSSFIPQEYQAHMKCIVDLDGVESKDDAPDTSYYQWVTFVMMVQAGTFMLPYRIWRALEGGLIEEFGSEAKTKIILEEEYGEDSLVMDQLVDKYVKFFRAIWHRNNWYFFMFVLCEILNCVVLFLNFWLTDVFLNGKFYTYGWDIIQYTRMSAEDQAVSINPFCTTFPLEVSCSVPNVGAAGGGQYHNGLCVLSQNIINEKMYIAVWFWTVLLIFIIPLIVIYRILTLAFKCFRSGLLMSKLGNTNDVVARRSVSYVTSKCFIGDWFVLYQISRNVNMYFFRTFIKELRRDMKKNPKKHHLSTPPVFNVNHISKGPYANTQSEIDEADDKFDLEDGDEGENNMYVDLPEEKTSLLTDEEEEAHNAPTLRRHSKVDDDVEAITAKRDPAGPPKVLPPRGHLGRKMRGNVGRGAGLKRGGGAKRMMGRGAGRMAMDPNMAMMMM